MENLLYWNTKIGKILAPMYLCWSKMWKSRIFFISHVGLWGWGQTTWYFDEFADCAISYHRPAHNRQSEWQNIIDWTHTWQQWSVSLSEDILTIKCGFNLRHSFEATYADLLPIDSATLHCMRYKGQQCAPVMITVAAMCEVSAQGAGDTILYHYWL